MTLGRPVAVGTAGSRVFVSSGGVSKMSTCEIAGGVASVNLRISQSVYTTVGQATAK